MKAETMKLRSAIKFFANNAGYATPPGRMACAMALAKAEREGRERGWNVHWNHDSMENALDMDFDSDKDRAKLADDLERGNTLYLVAMLQDADGNTLGALGGIYVSGWHDDYCRVVEAELMSEALYEERASMARAAKTVSDALEQAAA